MHAPSKTHLCTLAVEFWRHKYEREGKTRRAFEESLQALAMEQGIMEKQGQCRGDAHLLPHGRLGLSER